MSAFESNSKVFYGWWIVGACLISNLYVGGTIFFGFTAVFEPIANEFGWSYAQISLAASIRGLEISLLAPLMGFLIDRWGPRRIMFGGAIVSGLGLIFLSRITSLGMFYVAFILIAIGLSTCSSTVVMAAVVNWFRKNVAMASGIVASGIALGGLLVPLVTMLIDMFDWRTAMVIVGLGMWVIVLPLSLVVRHKPEQYGYQLDGEANITTVVHESMVSLSNTEVSTGVRQAIKSWAFWNISLVVTCQFLIINGVITHIMQLLL